MKIIYRKVWGLIRKVYICINKQTGRSILHCITINHITMALIITKSSDAQAALKLITSIGVEVTERLDGIEVADSDVDTVADLLKDEFIIHVIEY